jgi:Domain of unknown function DUF11
MRRAFLIPTLVLLLQLPVASATATHARFSSGDVLVGVGSNTVQWRHSDGGLDSTHPRLTTPISSPSTTGMAFDLADNLYVTGYTSNAISRFDPFGTANGTFGGGFNSHPESISFDTFGHAFVGQEGGNRDIVEFDAAGALSASHNAQIRPKGTDRVDVGPDQCTIYYTSQGQAVRRFNTCTGQQAPALISNLPGSEAFDVKVLTSSDPAIDGDVLVADTQTIVRVDGATGAVLPPQFDAAGQNCWTALAIATTPTRFWAGDRCTSNLYQFDLEGGSPVLGPIPMGARTSIQGLAVNGGLTAATAADVSVAIDDEPDPVSPATAGDPTFVHYAMDVTNNGHGIARNVSLQASVEGGTVHSASGQGWTCQSSSTSTTCTLPQLNIDTPAATIDLVVRTAVGATSVAVSGQVTADEPDQDLSNNVIDPNDPPQAADNGARTGVEPAQDDHVVSFCPAGGCSLDTDPNNSGPTDDDNTVTRFSGNGPGGIFRADEFDPPGPIPIDCGTDDDSQLIVFDPPPGHGPGNPAVLTVTMDTGAGVGGSPRPCTKDKVTGEDFEIPDCIIPGRAQPAPCLDDVVKGGGQVTTITLWTSGDPPFRH